MAEALFVYYLPASWNVSGQTKRQKIEEVLSWSPARVTVPDDLKGSSSTGSALVVPASTSTSGRACRSCCRSPGDGSRPPKSPATRHSADLDLADGCVHVAK
jgi:hypothetical protein